VASQGGGLRLVADFHLNALFDFAGSGGVDDDADGASACLQSAFGTDGRDNLQDGAGGRSGHEVQMDAAIPGRVGRVHQFGIGPAASGDGASGDHSHPASDGGAAEFHGFKGRDFGFRHRRWMLRVGF